MKEVVRVEWGWLIRVGWGGVGRGQQINFGFNEHEQKLTFSRFTAAYLRLKKLGRFSWQTGGDLNRKKHFFKIMHTEYKVITSEVAT